MRAVVTYDSTACEMASKPAIAVTGFGCDTVSVGSRIAVRNAALGSPHAIFTCVSASEMIAYDCASLPVPAVVGTPIAGSIGRVALPNPR